MGTVPRAAVPSSPKAERREHGIGARGRWALLFCVAASMACTRPEASSRSGQSAEAIRESPMFTSDAPVRFEIRAPFGKMNDRSRASFTEGQLDDGLLVTNGAEIPIKIGPRGRTSWDECLFRKLEAEIPVPDAAAGTAFADLASFKIATHCDLANGFSLFGRLGNEEGVYREELAYRWYRAMTPMALRTRLAEITYVDTDAPAALPLRKHAFVLEDFKTFRTRIGGTKVEVADVDRSKLDPTVLSTSYVFQLLIGNTDWQIGRMFRGGVAPIQEGTPLGGDTSTFNYKVFRTPTTDIPLPYDFDIAELIGGQRSNDEPPKLLEDRPPLVRRLANDLVGFWRLFPDAQQRRSGVEALLRARSEIERSTHASPVDAEGKKIARARIEAFFAAIAAMHDVRALSRGPLSLYERAAASTPFCTKVSGAHPVRVVGESGTRVAFRMLDEAFDHSECEGLPPFEFISPEKTLWVDRAKVVVPEL